MMETTWYLFASAPRPTSLMYVASPSLQPQTFCVSFDGHAWIAGEGGHGALVMAETDAQARIASSVVQFSNGFGIPKHPAYLSSPTSSIPQNFFVRLFVTREAATLSERGTLRSKERRHKKPIPLS